MEKRTVEQWIPLLIKITREFVGSTPDQDITDTEEYADGSVGLQRACEKYDSEYRTKAGKKVAFQTYAWHLIKNEIITGRKRRDAAAKLETTVLSALERNQEKPCEIPQPDPEKPIPTHLLKLFFEENENDTDTEKRYKTILREYYLSDLTLKEVGKKYNISKERVRQLVNLGLELIRKRFAHIIEEEKF